MDVGGTGAGQRFVASRIGTLMRRSLDMSERIYLAMLSRGFDGEIRIMHAFRMRRLDYLWMGISTALLGYVLWLDRLFSRSGI